VILPFILWGQDGVDWLPYKGTHGAFVEPSSATDCDSLIVIRCGDAACDRPHDDRQRSDAIGRRVIRGVAEHRARPVTCTPQRQMGLSSQEARISAHASRRKRDRKSRDG